MGDTFVTLVIHHRGKMIKRFDKKEKFWFIGGSLDVVEEKFDIDHLSLVNLIAYAKDLGYVNVNKIWVQDKKLGDFIELIDDSRVGEIATNLHNGETLDIYIDAARGNEHEVTEQGTQIGMEAIIEDEEQPDFSDDDDELLEIRKKVREAEKKEMENKKKYEKKGKDAECEGAKISEIEFINETDPVQDSSDSESDEKDEEEADSEYYDSDDVGDYISDADEEVDSSLTRGNDKFYFDETSSIPQFSLGMIFDNVSQFKMAISKYAVMKGVGLKFVKNEGVRVRVQCIPPCPWTVYASIERNDNSFMIKTYNPNHRCYRVSRNTMASSKFLATLLKDRIVMQPNIQLKQIKEICKSEYKVHVGIALCQRIKKKVMEDLLGDYKLQYGVLHDYVEEVLATNPGSTCMVQTSTENGKNEFLRFYVCFKGCKEGWKKGCRPIIGMDGCFLKGLCEGQLLCAIGRDGNDQIFPLAWAVVSVENKVNWQWFLRCLKHDLQLENGAGYTIISDMQKGLISAMKDELPQIHHRMCARHIYAAWAKEWRGDERKKVFWACTKSTYENQLKKNLDRLDKLGKGCVQDMLQYPLEQWVKCYFPTYSQCDIVDNNLSETFNGWILEARWKPVITMLEEIRKQVMNRIREKREFAEYSWICDISPGAMSKIEENKSASFNWYVTFNGDDGYEITSVYDRKNTHVVNLKGRRCSCRAWDLNGIPCQHAICAIYSVKEEPTSYVSKWYSKEVYLQAYAFPLNPLRGQNQWKKIEKEEILPPPYKSKPGRPKKNRRKDRDEIKKSGKLSRNGRKMTCSLCGQEGHNKKGHNKSISGIPKSGQDNQKVYATKLPVKRKINHHENSGVQARTKFAQNEFIPPRTILGHETKGLQWKGAKAVTCNQLQKIVQKKKNAKLN